MQIYTIAVTGAIVVSAAIMFLIFSRLKILSFKTLLSVSVSSLISAIALPGIFNLISTNTDGAVAFHTLLQVTAATMAIYAMCTFILSMMISYILPKIGAVPQRSGLQISEVMTAESGMVSENCLEQIYDTLLQENSRETTNSVESIDNAENNLEKSVDSNENIDKMGIENSLQESEILTIDECIEEAFRFKQQGDAEGAILYYMYALDRKPQKDLAFWIVLDICVIYKTLGQYELAFDILNSYYDVFGGMMDASVKEEIERNLINIQA